MITRMVEILTTLTDETQNAAIKQCAEKGFDTNRGIISLDESFINLNSVKFILVDAIDKRKLIQLPITVQKVILSNLESISRSLTSLVNGVDEIENLTNNIEQLNTAIWQYGLHNLSDELLGYLNRMNQIKNQEVEIATLRRSIQNALAEKQKLDIFVGSAEETVEKLIKLLSETELNKNRSDENVLSTTQATQNASGFLTTIQQNEITITQLLASTKTSNAEVLALESKINDFYGQVDNYRNKITSTSEDAQNTIKTNKDRTDVLIKELAELESQIKVQIQKATGFSLFHSFQPRQFELAKSKRYWVWTLFGLVVASLCVSVFVITTTTLFDVAFYIKLSMSLPLIYAITFCTVQYSRERKLEEEYAFKSNISISLVPYKELVEKLVDGQQPSEREKFTTFIIDAISKVYTSPTDKIFDGETKLKGSNQDSLKQLEKALRTVIEPIKPIIEAMKH